MTGTLAGGRKAAKTTKERHGEDFYARIGQKGGANSHEGGFASNRELARIAGRKGGSMSRRGKAYAPLFAEKRKQILELWYKNTPYTEIARQIGLPYSATRAWVRKNVEGKDA